MVLFVQVVHNSIAAVGKHVVAVVVVVDVVVAAAAAEIVDAVAVVVAVEEVRFHAPWWCDSWVLHHVVKEGTARGLQTAENQEVRYGVGGVIVVA